MLKVINKFIIKELVLYLILRVIGMVVIMIF